jgi:hypothetical protein
VKQRWLLKQANISVEIISSSMRRVQSSSFRLNLKSNSISKLFYRIKPQIFSNVIRRNLLRLQLILNNTYPKNVLFNQFFHFFIFRDLYLAYIDQLLLYNPPDILGLHSNAEINYLNKAAMDIYSTMLDIQPEQNETEDHSSRERKETFIKAMGQCSWF